MDQFGSGSTPGQSPLPAQTPGVWPPPPAGTPFGQSEEVNTSGMKGEVPPEIARLKWNWGAFSMNWLWCLNHRLTWWGIGILVLSFIPYAGLLTLPIAIYFGISGHKLSWQNRRFDGGMTQFFSVETAWMKWGIGIFVLNLVLVPILAAVLFPVFAKAREKARLRSGYYGRLISLPHHVPQAHPRS